MKTFNEFSNESVSLPTIKEIVKFISSNTRNFENESNDDEAIFVTREHGDVGDEQASPIDFAEAKKLANLVQKKFSNVTTEIEDVDEWVYLYVRI